MFSLFDEHAFRLTRAAAVALALPAIQASAHSNDETKKIAEDAYVFAYPMLYNYQTLYTQTQDSTFPGYVGGFDRYRHYARPATPADIDIVTPNNDTTYSWAWLDRRREPIVFETPELDKGRYNVFQWVDLYTHIFASPGSRLTGEKAAAPICSLDRTGRGKFLEGNRRSLPSGIGLRWHTDTDEHQGPR